jgi:hypothetical protein
MTDDEVEAFLGGCEAVVVAVIGGDGWPVATVARSRPDVGLHVVELPGDDLVSRCARPGASVCSIADSGESYFELKGVVTRGQVLASQREGEVQRVELRPERIISFDFGKLPEAGRTGGRPAEG